MLSQWPTGRRVAVTTVFCLAVALTIAALAQGLALSGPLRTLEIAGLVVTATAVIGGLIGLVVAKLADYRDPESEAEFERLVVRSAGLGRGPGSGPPVCGGGERARETRGAGPDEGEFEELDPFDRSDFETLVREAL